MVFLLMSICAVVVMFLQFYYTAKNFEASRNFFVQHSNEALYEAVDSAFALHRKNVAKQVGTWLADTSYVEVKSRWDTLKQETVFILREPGSGYESGALSLGEIKGKHVPVTPKVKAYFISQIEKLVYDQLEKGGILYLTQDLGKRIDSAYYDKPPADAVFEKQYILALKRSGINIPFTIADNKEHQDEYCTGHVNAGLREQRLLKACFSDVEGFLLGQQKWVITGSLLLILIILACFWYTARTLISQQKLNRIKDEFISNMTHELHTPITSVLVTAEALKKFKHDEESQKSYVDIIVSQCQKLSALTDEILTSARIDKQGITIKDNINVNQMLQQVAAGFKSTIVQWVVPNTAVYVKGNSLHLANAVSNLVDNALKYNTSVKPEVSVSLSVSGVQLIITIADNGPGIPDGDKKKIFEQFYRLTKGNVHDVKGYGLGLSYVKRVLHAHKGTIAVKDNQPSGAKFIIKIPL